MDAINKERASVQPSSLPTWLRLPYSVAAWLAVGVIATTGPSWAETSPAAVVLPEPSKTSSEVPLTKGAFLGYRTALLIGLERHPSLRKAHETAKAAGAVAEQAASRYYPELNAYAIQTGGTIRPLSAFNIAGSQNKPTSYVESAGVRADQLIYDFGQTAHTVSAERAGQEAAEKEILAKKALVILRVQQAYLQCLRQKRFVEIAEETVRERGLLREQIAILFKRQLKSKLDLDLISVELKNAEVQLLQARNELRGAFAALNNAMGVRGPDEYTLGNVPTNFTQVGPLESFIQEALDNRPELMASSDRIRQAHERLASARALALPTVSTLGMYGVIHFSDAPTNQYAGSHPGQTNLWWGAGAMISIPIFTGFLIENRVAEAREQKYKVEQRQVALSNQITLEVSEAYLTLQTAIQQVKVAEQQAATARESLDLATERYRLGLASIVDVTSATTALVSAEVQLAQTRYASRASAVALLYATGKGLQEF